MTHPHAIAAIKAAKNHNIWGRFATHRYLAKRNVHTHLFTLARVLEAAKKAGL